MQRPARATPLIVNDRHEALHGCPVLLHLEEPDGGTKSLTLTGDQRFDVPADSVIDDLDAVLEHDATTMIEKSYDIERTGPREAQPS